MKAAKCLRNRLFYYHGLLNIIFSPGITFGFEQMMYTVYEGDEVEVCVNLIGELDKRTVVVTLATDDMLSSGGMLSKEQLSIN